MGTRYAYQEYFGLSENPFSITPDPRFIYLSDKHRAALEHLEYGAAEGSNGFVLLTGDVGTGKTTLCRAFLERLPEKTEVILILNPVLSLNEFLQTLCDELDLVIAGSRDSNKNLIDHLNRFLLQVYAIGHKTILIIDEAQNLSHELLEQIRLLTNLESNTDKLLQVFLIGQPELRDMLERPELLQVSQRITGRYHLGPLSRAETGAYIMRRLEVAGGHDLHFNRAAIRQVYRFSGGVPRLINVLCEKALLSAYQRSAENIDMEVVGDAERRVLGTVESTDLPRTAAAGVLSILLLGAAAGAIYWTNVANLRTWIDAQWMSVAAPDLAESPTLAESPDVAPLPQAPPQPAMPAGSVTADDQATIDTMQPRTRLVAPQTTPADTAADQAAPASVAAPGDAVVAGEAYDAAVVPPAPPPAAESPVRDSAEIPPPAAPPSPSRPAPAADQSLIDYTRRYAERRLLAMWGVDDSEPDGLDFCESAATHGLQCLRETSGLPGLYRYDRPAILFLKIADVSSYAMVLKARPDRVVLDVLDREHVIPANALDEVWDGSFTLLWRRSGGFEGNLALGASGPAAVWLRRAMDRIDGVNSSGNVVDEALVARIRRFQRTAGLAADGIVGPRTLILLQNALAEAAG